MRVAVLLAVVCLPCAHGTFTPGSFCNHMDPSSNARTFVHGKHLRVGEIAFEPFGIPPAEGSPPPPPRIDGNSLNGWTGLDIDLILRLSQLMGFTFEVHTMNQTAGESWDSILARNIDLFDVVLSYWVQTAERRETFDFAKGHVDYSTTLVSRWQEEKESTFWQRLTGFLAPFEYDLWAAIIGLIVASGLVDYAMQRMNEKHLGDSLYEYFAGSLWGGFQDPRNKLSAVYQITVAFVFLITISSYTANLAAALTTSSLTQEVDTMAQLMAERKPACHQINDPMADTYKVIYPSLTYDTRAAKWDDLRLMMVNRSCDAALAPAIMLTTWLSTSPQAACYLRNAQTVLQADAGWVTSPLGPCVRRGLDIGLQELLDDGSIQLIFNRWFAVQACGEVEQPSEDRRRRLKEHANDARQERGRFAQGSASEGHPASRTRRRRLAPSGKAGSVAGAVAAGGGDAVEKLSLEDFTGVFVLWGMMSTIVISIRMCTQAAERRRVPDRVSGLVKPVKGSKGAAAMEQVSESSNKFGSMLRDAMNNAFGVPPTNEQVANAEANDSLQGAVQKAMADALGAMALPAAVALPAVVAPAPAPAEEIADRTPSQQSSFLGRAASKAKVQAPAKETATASVAFSSAASSSVAQDSWF